jgi:hypothetical protein
MVINLIVDVQKEDASAVKRHPEDVICEVVSREPLSY